MSVSPLPVSVPRARSGVPLLALAGVLWGTGGLLGQALATATGLSAPAVATYRLAGGGLLLCLYVLLSGRRLPATAAARWRVLAVGGLAALFQCSYFLAVTTSSVSLATLVAIGVAPVVVLAVEAVARLRRVGPRSVVGAALALLGLTLLVGPGAGPIGPGAALAVVAGAGFAAMTLLSARPVPGLDAATTTGLGFAVGGALLVPVAWLADPAGLGFAPTPAALGLLVALALVPTALAYTAYFVGLGSAPAGVGAVLALLEPLTAAVLAALLFGERLGVTGWVGAAVLCGAVALTGHPVRVVPSETPGGSARVVSRCPGTFDGPRDRERWDE